MKSPLTVALSFLSIGLLFTLLCSPSQSDVDAARKEGYESGYAQGSEDSSGGDHYDFSDAYDEGYRDGIYDGYEFAGSDSEIDYYFLMVLEEAKSYAIENVDEIMFWDAMDIVSVYLDGHDPSGYPLPTRKEFEESVDVLLRYAIFLEWNTESFASIAKGYDPFYG